MLSLGCRPAARRRDSPARWRDGGDGRLRRGQSQLNLRRRQSRGLRAGTDAGRVVAASAAEPWVPDSALWLWGAHDCITNDFNDYCSCSLVLRKSADARFSPKLPQTPPECKLRQKNKKNGKKTGRFESIALTTRVCTELSVCHSITCISILTGLEPRCYSSVRRSKRI